jgi:isopentenyl-diphosphate delta-isomerase
LTREETLVELVDPAGVPIGSATVGRAHAAPGQLHRAFSVLLVDAAGRLLLQQRAESKTRFPLRWANACCGHPAPAADLVASAAARLFDELGLGSIELRPIGVYVYRAPDPVTGRVEHEYDHVLVGRIEGQVPRPNPAEVAAVRWASPGDLHDHIATGPANYAPWLSGVVTVWQRAAMETPGGR